MKNLLKYFFILLIFSFLSKTNATEEMNSILENIRCLVCQGQSVADSNSDFALTVKSIVKEKLAEGDNEQDIYNFLSQRYGDWIIFKPKFDEKNFLLWIIPYLFLVFGVFFILNIYKKGEKIKIKVYYYIMNLIKTFSITMILLFHLSNLHSEERNHILSFFTGQFDIIDKEGDDKTHLVGFEHNDENLFRDTFLGKFSPVSGAFITGKNSLYFYTGIQADYDLGKIKLTPSFTPGYYEKGNGKDLGVKLSLKSEIKIGFDILKNTNIGYSYSHISNNDWGSSNPGTDNQQFTLTTKF